MLEERSKMRAEREQLEGELGRAKRALEELEAQRTKDLAAISDADAKLAKLQQRLGAATRALVPHHLVDGTVGIEPLAMQKAREPHASLRCLLRKLTQGLLGHVETQNPVVLQVVVAGPAPVRAQTHLQGVLLAAVGANLA